MEKENKILVIGALGIFLFLIVVNIQPVSAEFLACFSSNEIINYCDLRPEGGTYNKDDQTCDQNSGCSRCMSKFYENKDGGCFIHGVWPKCNQLPQECTVFGSNTNFDIDPPVLTINNPIKDKVYDSRNVLLDLEVNEKADIYYTDLDDGRGRWTRVCSDCSSYSRERSFNEGLSNLSFRVKDVVGNTAFFNVSFIIDSQDPKIRSTSPTGGFVNTILKVEFKEANPVSVEVTYGNDETGFEVDVGLDLVDDCEQDGDELSCEIDVDLTAYDGQDIEYWFTVEDIAGNVDESRHYTLSVDDSDPVILNGPIYTIDGKYVYFSIEIDEANLDEVGYSYIDDRGRLKEKRLCSRLKDGFCEKRVSFKDGDHDLTVYIIDEAGNNIGVLTSFFIDSKAPKIKKTLPTRGYANGDFYVEFQETNPSELTLYYGTVLDMRTSDVVIESECESIKEKSDKQACDVSVGLTDYDGQEIEYWFTLTDIVGNEVESRHYELDVDTTYPELVNDNPLVGNVDSFFEVDGRYVYFSLNIIEENLDEVTYSYIDDRDREREKRLCSRLKNDVCEKRVSFRDGIYELTIKVTDDAGNQIGVPASFEVIR